jgi:hypothetical protein
LTTCAVNEEQWGVYDGIDRRGAAAGRSQLDAIPIFVYRYYDEADHLVLGKERNQSIVERGGEASTWRPKSLGGLNGQRFALIRPFERFSCPIVIVDEGQHFGLQVFDAFEGVTNRRR